MNIIRLAKRERLILLILFLAFLIRCYHLRFQSFGLDELHSMNECDPHFFTWGGMIHFLKTNDQHPPLFFICERILFTIFGANERVARAFTAFCGLLGVFAIYLLGKELAGRRLGHLAAALTCVNYFCIFYSQETRDYSLAFFLSTLSYYFFIRLVRSLGRRDMWYYSITTCALLYTHYFGLLIFASQLLIAFILLFAEKDKWLFSRRFALGAGIIVLGFALWLPGLKQVSDIHSFWIKPITEDFVFEFFAEYFGNAAVLVPILFLALTFYVLNVFLRERRRGPEIKHDPLLLSFLLLSVSVTIVYMVPFIRSILVVPMLISRYTIIVLPLFLLAVAYGIDLIPNDIIKYLVMGVFITLSLTDLLVVKNFYGTVRNTQFRDLSAYIAADTAHRFPVINDRTGWQQDFYLRKFNYNVPIFSGPRTSMVDSILKKSSPRYAAGGFWLVDAFYEPAPRNLLDPNTQKALDDFFILAKDSTFFDAWAQFYLRKDFAAKVLDTGTFDRKRIFEQDGQKVVLDLGGPITSDPFPLSNGNYIVVVSASGQPAVGVYPHLVLSVGHQRIGDYMTDGSYTPKRFTFAMPVSTDTARLTIDMDNDYWDPVTHEDRNAFIKQVSFIKE